MPIYIRYDDIKGDVDHNRAGGINVLIADGSVRTISRSASGAAVGNINSAAPVSAVEVSKIFAPNAAFGVKSVDSREANVIAKTKMLLDTARGLTNGLVVSIPRAARPMQSANNLKQLGLGSHGRIPALGFYVFDIGNPQGVSIEFENVLVSSYQSGAHSSANQPMDSFSLNFTKIEYKNL